MVEIICGLQPPHRAVLGSNHRASPAGWWSACFRLGRALLMHLLIKVSAVCSVLGQMLFPWPADQTG